MKKSSGLIAIATVSLMACGGPATEAPATTTAPGGVVLEQKPAATLAQMMRAIPFTSANIIFDTQTNDPEAPPKEAASGDSATARFSSIYKGWPLVEQSALALVEAANLMMIPGRLCENGKPVPLDREDFRKGILGLAEAGRAAYKAAQSKNQDQMIEVSNTVTEACLVCHEVYRDVPDATGRCTPPAAAAAPPK
jgi:hypothetical protein